MEETLGWVSSINDQERLLAFWLYGDVFVDAAPVTSAWSYGGMVGLCELTAQTPALANLRARSAECP